MIQNILLMAPADGGGAGKEQLITLVLVVGIFFAFMVLPQIRRNKKLKNFREALKKGDKVVTIGGIHGKILEVRTNTFVIDTEGGGKLTLEKSAVSMDSQQLIGSEAK
jgi:preprotein translocase subunit YajC